MCLNMNLINKIQWLTPNEHELQLLFPTDDTKPDGAEGERWSELLSRMPERIVMTKGGDGALWCGADGHIHHAPGQPVEVVDTTGAGDTFNGALAVALAEGRSFSEAIHWAVGAGALSVTKFGAQGGMPMREELDEWLISRLASQ